MDQNAPSSWTATPGDILLLSGQSKTRPFNLAYQGVMRKARADYTHVALVISPFRVIHAVPDKGVEIVAWRDIRADYDIQASSVARLTSMDDTLRERLTAQAYYYFGQRYSLAALRKPSPTFSDQQGIVCSQFVAQVFHDIGVQSGANGNRDCLPADIHTHTEKSPDWARLPLCDYLFDRPPTHAYDILGDTLDVLFELDGLTAKGIKDTYWMSRAGQSLETALQSIVLAVKAGHFSAEDLQLHQDPSVALSTKNWESVWIKYFATPHSDPSFLHEAGKQAGPLRLEFIEACDLLGKTAETAHEHMDAMKLLLDQRLAQLTQDIASVQPDDFFREFTEVDSALLNGVAALDRSIGWDEHASHDNALDVRQLLESGIFTCEEDVTEATRCLSSISIFANARNRWSATRAVMLAYSANMASLIEQHAQPVLTPVDQAE